MVHCKLLNAIPIYFLFLDTILSYVFNLFITSKVLTSIHSAVRKMLLFIIPLKPTLSGIPVAIATKSPVDSSSQLNP